MDGYIEEVLRSCGLVARRFAFFSRCVDPGSRFGFADSIHLRLPLGHVFHKLLMVFDQAFDDGQVVGQRLRFQRR